MKKLILAFFVMACSLQVFSQKIYFAYIQSENRQPFFVRMSDRVHSSSATGYVILSRLLDSTYTIFVGFPGENGEQKFTVPINHKDKGYLLKNTGDKGWALFDLQTMQLQMSQNAVAKTKTVPDEEVSPFTEILSKAADDPTLKEKTVVPVAKKDPVIPAVQKEELAVPVASKEETKKVDVEKEETKTVETKTEPVKSISEPLTRVTEQKLEQEKPVQEKPGQEKPVPEEKKAVTSEPVASTVPIKEESKKDDQGNEGQSKEIIRHSQKEGAEGHDVVFIDRQESKDDTIRVFIPADKTMIAKKETSNEPPKEEKKFLDITSAPVTTPIKEENETKSETPAAKKSEPNACTETANDNDFIKLRRKMVAADDNDAMVAEARKVFKTKCFTVYQIRNLSALFLDDEGKYNFFDAAYRYASDAHNFISLKLELKEGYWVKRFEAMLR